MSMAVRAIESFGPKREVVGGLTCAWKNAFKSKDAAAKAKRGHLRIYSKTDRKRKAPSLEVYKCKHCGNYHLGHRPWWKQYLGGIEA